MFRTNTCGELTKEYIGQKVALSGWVQTVRDHGGVLFIDLRDAYGVTQIVTNEDLENIPKESVITVSGKVRARDNDTVNSKIVTGDIEVVASDIKVLSKSAMLPFEVTSDAPISDDLRLKYRFLDLRRPEMQEKIRFRHKVVTAAREFLNDDNFVEIETPLLVKSTPEGARDYVVPSRVNAGEFYALPQSPQLYKQILMISGFDKYYQIARCLRDEDLRADRQPEHTQLDFEMSFVTSDEIRAQVEKLMKHVFKKALNKKLDDFQTLSYADSMSRFGTDKPDTRFGLELTDVTDIVKDSDFTVFKQVVKSGGIVKCINPDAEFGRNEVDKYIEYCQSIGSKGMAWMKVTKDGLDSNIVKFFSDDIQKKLLKATGAKKGYLMFIADKPKPCNDVISKLRLKLGADMNLIKKDKFSFAWIVDFPLFAYDEDTEKWAPEHHMFSMPKPEFVDTFDKDPAPVLGDLWDLVLNGTEMASGSIRVSNPEIQKRILNLIGYSEKEAQERFGFLLDAYEYGGPVHGGMGIGVDRLVAMMLGLTDIREVIAFPKNKSARCPMDGCPSKIGSKQLKELKVKLDVLKK